MWLLDAQRRSDRVALNKAVEALAQAAGRADASSETLAELGRVKGVGAAKLERWGSDVLEVVTRHLDGQSASSSSSAR